MLENEMSDAIKELPTERRINAIAAVVIVSVLWAILVVIVRSWGNDLRDENKLLKARIETITNNYQNKVDSLNAQQYKYVLQELQQEKQVKDYNNYQDSLNHELLKIRNQLISK